MSVTQPSTLKLNSEASPSAVHHANNDTKPPAVGWTMPSITEARSVLPDLYTDPTQLDKLPGKEVDPSRMGIFICLLDDRPHLHPNLAALHKHRLVVHFIPSPADPGRDIPVPQGMSVEGKEEWMTWRYTEEEEQRRKSYLPLA